VDGVTGRADQPRHWPARAVAEPPPQGDPPGLFPSGVRPVLPGARCQEHGARFAARIPPGQVTITSYDPDGGIVVTVHEQVAREGVNAA
jgi:hypothetical protein